MNQQTEIGSTPVLDTCSLSEACAGRRYRVRELSAQPGLCRRLREMGFCESSEFHLVNKSTCLLCEICGAKVALSAQLAKSILVEPSGR